MFFFRPIVINFCIQKEEKNIIDHNNFPPNRVNCFSFSVDRRRLVVLFSSRFFFQCFIPNCMKMSRLSLPARNERKEKRKEKHSGKTMKNCKHIITKKIAPTTTTTITMRVITNPTNNNNNNWQ